MNGLPKVVTLFPEQYDGAAVALGRAFIHDPPLKAILPGITEPEARARHLADLFRVALGIQRRTGQPVFGVLERGRVIAAAVVEGAGGTSGAGMMLTSLVELPRMVRAVGWGGTMRGINLMSVLVENHPHEPHIYLNLLGVDPGAQHRHCGSALLEHLRELAAARDELAGVYLETATEANVAYYSARGYEVIGEIFPLGVRMWRMFQRKPKAG
jgi:ribosomal protein S18 acetylase RimI-like enzyme